MSDFAALLTAIGSVLGVISTGVMGIIALRTGSPKERRDAGRKAIERILETDDEDADDDRIQAIAELVEQLEAERRRKKGKP